MINQLVSDNYWNELLLIASKTIFKLILGPSKIKYLPLMSWMKERQFLIAVHFIFPVMLLLTQRSALFPS